MEEPEPPSPNPELEVDNELKIDKLLLENDQLKQEKAELENDLLIAEGKLSQQRELAQLLRVESDKVKNLLEEGEKLRMSLEKEVSERKSEHEQNEVLTVQLMEAERQRDVEVREKETLSKSFSKLNQELVGLIEQVNQYGECCESSDGLGKDIYRRLEASVLSRLEDYHKKNLELMETLKQDNLRVESVTCQGFEGPPAPQPSTVSPPHSSSVSHEISPSESPPVLYPAFPHGVDPSKVLACVCTRQFKSERSLSFHVAKNGDAEWKFRCDHCQQIFYLFERFKEHHTTVHSNLPGLEFVNGCYLCGNLYKCRTEYIKHRKDAHMQESVKSRPNIKTEPQEGYPVHGFDNSRGRNSDLYFCLCGFQTKYKQNLKVHISYRTTEPKLKCDQCPKLFRQNDSLRGHMMKAHNIDWNKHGCGRCGLKFDTRTELLEHRRTSHRVGGRYPCIDFSMDGDAENAPAPSPSDGLPVVTSQHRRDESSQDLQCICGPSKFSNLAQFRLHIKIKTGRKLFECNICNQKFRMLNHLRMHLKSKHKVKKDQLPPLFGCGTCGREFSTRSWLMLHRNKSHPRSKVSKKRHAIDWSKKDLGHYCTCGTKTRSRPLLHNHIDTFMGEGSSTPLHRPTEEPALVPSTSRYSFGIPAGPSTFRESTRAPTFEDSTRLNRIILEPEPVQSTSRGPSSAIPPGPSTFPERRSRSPTFGDLSDSDMISDDHLTREPILNQNVHEASTDLVNQGLFFCKCNREFNDKRGLTSHVNYYLTLTKTKFICQTCRQTFFTTGELKGHMWQKHRIVLKEKNGCKICGKTFTTAMELLTHRKSVHKVRTAPVDIKFEPARKDEPPPDASHRILPHAPGQLREDS